MAISRQKEGRSRGYALVSEGNTGHINIVCVERASASHLSQQAHEGKRGEHCPHNVMCVERASGDNLASINT